MLNNHLYFICPTDNLEVIINKTFKENNYYFTSLANTIMFDVDEVGHISSLIETEQISKITFVLSDDNQIIKEVLHNKDYSNTEWMKKFHLYINSQKKRFNLLTNKQHSTTPILSYYLNSSVKKLKHELSAFWFSNQVTVDATIYDRKKNRFNKTSLDRFYKDHFHLN